MHNGHDLASAFQRSDDGSLLCIEAVTIDHPIGRIQLSIGTRLIPGTSFMGVDLVGWLEQHLTQPSQPPAE